MNLRRRVGRATLGQSITEMALVLPIMLLLVYGVFELGRVVYIFSALNNASREAARFGAAAGLSDGGTPNYLDCAAIREAARETAFLAGLTDGDIQIAYDTPVAGKMTVFAHCGEVGLDRDDLRLGDRIVISVTKTVRPIIPVLPGDGFSLSFATARTVLKDIALGPVECSDDLDNDGDSFTDWDGDGGSPDTGCSGPDDTTEAECFSLSVASAPAEGGTLGIQPDPNCANNYVEQTLVHLTASATERYIFKRWSGSINTTNNPTTVVMDGDKNIIAEFRLLTADLSVSKSASPSPAYAESTLSYDVQITNLYTDTARDVVITDTLPAGVQLQGWSISAGSCPEANNATVICHIPALPTGSTATLSIDVLTPVVDYLPTTLTNYVEVSAFEFDPDLTNNATSVTTEVRPRAELTAHQKSDSADPVYAAANFAYTVTVGNSGPSVATGVVVADNLPAGMSFVSSPDDCVTTGSSDRNVRCNVGELAVGATTSVLFTVRAPKNGRTVTNVATVFGNEYEANGGDNATGEETVVISRADLLLQKDAPSSAARDDPFNYVLSVTNLGPSDAEDVQIVDTLPGGVQYDSFGSVDAGTTCSLSGSTVTCNLGTILEGDTHQLTLKVTPTIDEGTITNSATVDSSTEDPIPTNNDDSASTTVTTDVNLDIVKTSSAPTVNRGDAFAYTIRVDNVGASHATGVEVVDTLPDGINFVGAVAPDGWSCTATGTGEGSGATVTCAPGDGILPGGTAATITLNVTAGQVGTYVNYVRVTAVEDTTAAEAQTVVEANLDLSLSLTAPATGTVGVPFDYVITVANNGPSNATSVVVASPLDSAVTFEGLTLNTSGSWACTYVNDQDGRRVLCTALTMAAGAEATFTISVEPIIGVETVLSQGTVSADESAYDTNPGNDAASATTTLDGSTTTTGPDD